MTGEDTREWIRIDAEGTTGRSTDTSPDDPPPVLAAYDVVKGVDAFIVAAVDSDDAWLAVEAGGERDLAAWR